MTPASGATDYLGKRDERAQEELPPLVRSHSRRAEWHV
jgi:hypothetical protein